MYARGHDRGVVRGRAEPATATNSGVHYGTADEVRAQRAVTLDAAYLAHPERFVSKPPTPPTISTTSWINRPEEEATTTT